MSATLDIKIVDSGEGVAQEAWKPLNPQQPNTAPSGIDRDRYEDAKPNSGAADLVDRFEMIGKELLNGLKDPTLKELLSVTKSIAAILIGQKISKAARDAVKRTISPNEQAGTPQQRPPAPPPSAQPAPPRPPAPPRTDLNAPGRTVEGTVIRRPSSVSTVRETGLTTRPPAQLPALVRPQTPVPLPGAAAASTGLTTLGAVALGVAGGLAIVGVAVGVGVAAINRWSAAMRDEARQLVGLSASVASVASLNNIRMQLARFDRAQAIGGDLSRVSTLQGRYDELSYRAQTAFYDTALKAFNVVEPAVATGVGILGEIVKEVEHFAEIARGLEAVAEAGVSAVLDRLGSIGIAIRVIWGILDKDETAPGKDPLLNAFNRMLEGVSVPPRKG